MRRSIAMTLFRCGRRIGTISRTRSACSALLRLADVRRPATERRRNMARTLVTSSPPRGPARAPVDPGVGLPAIERTNRPPGHSSCLVPSPPSPARPARLPEERPARRPANTARPGPPGEQPPVAQGAVADQEYRPAPSPSSASSAASSAGAADARSRRRRLPGISHATSPRRMSMTGMTVPSERRARGASTSRLVAVTTWSPRRAGEGLGRRDADPQPVNSPGRCRRRSASSSAGRALRDPAYVRDGGMQASRPGAALDGP